MDFSRTQYNGLFNSIAHEKTKYINVLYKIKTILAACKGNKLISKASGRMALTSSPNIIAESINFSHPIHKILLELLEKTKKLINGDKMFINVVENMIDKIYILLDNGIKAKIVSDAAKYILSTNLENKMGLVIDDFEKMNLTEKEQFLLDKRLKNLIKDTVGDEFISNLLINCMECTEGYDYDKIRILKVQTGSLEDSYIIDGIVVDRVPESKVKSLNNTSVGLFNCPLDIARTELKGTLVFNNHKQLLNFSVNEMESAKKLVDSLNINVLFISGNINELFMDFINDRNILVLRIFNKFDMKRISDMVNGNIHNFLGPIKSKGYVENISTFEDGGRTFTKIVSSKGKKIKTIVLKHSIGEMLDEMERKISYCLDSLNNKKSYDNEKSSSHFNMAEDDFNCKMAEIVEKIDSSKISISITRSFSNALESLMEFDMIKADKIKAIKYAFDFLATILEVDDYLVAKADKLDIKPRDDPNWDD